MVQIYYIHSGHILSVALIAFWQAIKDLEFEMNGYPRSFEYCTVIRFNITTVLEFMNQVPHPRRCGVSSIRIVQRAQTPKPQQNQTRGTLFGKILHGHYNQVVVHQSTHGTLLFSEARTLVLELD